MSSALSALPGRRTPADLLRDFTTRVADWTDPRCVGDAVAAVLCAEPECVAATVLHMDFAAQALVVIGSAGASGAALPIGLRVPLKGAPGRAIRARKVQRTESAGGKETEIVVPTLTGRVSKGLVLLQLDGTHEHPTRLEEAASQIAAPLGVSLELPSATPDAVVERLQQQLLLSEKMAALGRITAGIAHEINSPLGSILNSLRMARGYVEEYRDSVGDPEIGIEDHHAIATDLLGAIELADTATQRVAQFVRSIKSQTRRAGEEGDRLFDVATEVDAAVLLLQYELRRRQVAVFTEMERGLQLRGDRGKLGVVLQNLLRNAIDAFHGTSGEIWIRLWRDGSHLRLDVEDHGSGIPEEIRSCIFDYLFTTKSAGRGTGLGLSMVHSIVTAHFKGEIRFHSQVGKGTTFTVLFPHRAED